jgi:hypothetical protein
MKYVAVFSKPHQAFFKLTQEDGRLGVRLCDLDGFKTNPGQTTRLCPKDCIPAEEMVEQQTRLAGHKLILLSKIRNEVLYSEKKTKTFLDFSVDFLTGFGWLSVLMFVLSCQEIQPKAMQSKKVGK